MNGIGGRNHFGIRICKKTRTSTPVSSTRVYSKRRPLVQLPRPSVFKSVYVNGRSMNNIVLISLCPGEHGLTAKIRSSNLCIVSSKSSEGTLHDNEVS